MQKTSFESCKKDVMENLNLLSKKVHYSKNQIEALFFPIQVDLLTKMNASLNRAINKLSQLI